jgi:hypothetical protein
MSDAQIVLAVPVRPCTPWCDNRGGDGHPNEHPEDRHCSSGYAMVPLTHRHHSPSQYTDGTWGLPYLNVYLRREPDHEVSHVVIHSEETDKELYLSRTEVLTLIEHLTALVDQLEPTTG